MKKVLYLLSFLAMSFGVFAQEKIILLNEGNWQSDNGRITYFEDGKIVSNQWFRDVNGKKLGDTPNDIIQIKPNLIAISVNWSNIIQFIDATGHDIGATEDLPNNRRLATDGQYLYISSYGHECQTIAGKKTFTKGLVAKIDVSNFKVLDAVEVGYEPDGIACYKGKLFVANTGGYAYQEDHDYEKTVSVIDAATMKVERTIDTGQINLYGDMSQSGQYLCINSAGDYRSVSTAVIVFDCQAAIDGKPAEQCFVKYEGYAATYSTTTVDGKFFAIGSAFSYYSGEYKFNYLTIDPHQAISSGGAQGFEKDTLPGTMLNDIKNMQSPYGIYVNPYTGYIYATDAGNYSEAGKLYQWSPQGSLLGKHNVYISPGHFLALNPKGEAGVESIEVDTDFEAETPYYNLQGVRIDHPQPGQLYIRNGRKIIY